jgi:hypothetical protein
MSELTKAQQPRQPALYGALDFESVSRYRQRPLSNYLLGFFDTNAAPEEYSVRSYGHLFKIEP